MDPVSLHFSSLPLPLACFPFVPLAFLFHCVLKCKNPYLMGGAGSVGLISRGDICQGRLRGVRGEYFIYAQ